MELNFLWMGRSVSLGAVCWMFPLMVLPLSSSALFFSMACLRLSILSDLHLFWRSSRVVASCLDLILRCIFSRLARCSARTTSQVLPVKGCSMVRMRSSPLLSYQTMDSLSMSRCIISSRLMRCRKLASCLKIPEFEWRSIALTLLFYYCQSIRYLIGMEKADWQRELQYSNKLVSIETKFKFICQHYAQVTEELARKKELIEELNRKIDGLEGELTRMKEIVKDGENERSWVEHNKIYTHRQNRSVATGVTPTHSESKIENRFSKDDGCSFSKQSTVENTIKQDKEKVENRIEPVVKPSFCSILRKSEESDKFEQTLATLKQRIAAKPFATPFIAQKSSLNDMTNIKMRQSRDITRKQGPLSRVKSTGNIKVLLKDQQDNLKGKTQPEDDPNIKTLHRIWQQRDKQIIKMDELFDSLNTRLKQFE